MTPLVLVVIAAMWVVVLVPPLLRSRKEHRPAHSVTDFRRQLSHLGRMPAGTRAAAVPPRYRTAAPRPVARSVGAAANAWAPAPTYTASSRSVARQRRANVLLGLAAVAAFFAGGAIATQNPIVVAGFLVSLAALGGYVLLLASAARAEEDRAARDRWYREHAA